MLGSGPCVATKAEALALTRKKLKVVPAGKRERDALPHKKRA
ncbi:hypothetical protein [Caballeronia temeraria]